MSESPISILERWEAAGGIWRTRSLSETEARVDLCTCHGDPVDELRTSDRALLRYLELRPRSDAG